MSCMLFVLGLSSSTKSAETFLLTSAALANLTFMEPTVVLMMRKHQTVKVLVGKGFKIPCTKYFFNFVLLSFWIPVLGYLHR